MFIEYYSEAELDEAISEFELGSLSHPAIHLGRGSNLLFGQKVYKGLALHSGVTGFTVERETDESVRIIINAGQLWDDVVAFAAEQGLYGVENLSGIPGEAGGCTVQNIGAYGVELKDVIDWVEFRDVTNGGMVRLSCKECGFGYRSSIFSTPALRYVVLRTCIRLGKCSQAKLEYKDLQGLENNASPAEIRSRVLAVRRAKLPDYEVEGNAGSFFMNPSLTPAEFAGLRADIPDIPRFDGPDGRIIVPAARLIEECGMKGRGGRRAGVSARHALVIVNRGGARGSDILLTANRVWRKVYERFGISLTAEVKYISNNEDNFPWNRHVDRRS